MLIKNLSPSELKLDKMILATPLLTFNGVCYFIVKKEFYRQGDWNTIDQHVLPVPVTGRYFRFNPTQVYNWNCLRVEIYETVGKPFLSFYFFHSN